MIFEGKLKHAPPGATLGGACLACPSGTGPTPILRRSHQPCRNRILFDICHNPAEFLLIPHPVIVGLILPKWLAGSLKQQIRLSGRPPFEPMCNLGQRDARQNQQVYMVRHNRPGLQFVELLLTLAGANRFHYTPCYSRITQRTGPMTARQRPILCGERMTGSRVNDVGRRNGQRPVQSPRHK